MMTPFFRKLGLTGHITSSVGWLGAVAAFLVLAIAGLSSENNLIVRSSYITMELIGWFIIIPFSITALLSGIVQSLGTTWGLFRHYWIVVKLILTIVAIIILLVHMQPISYMADVASGAELSNSEFRGLRIQLIADAGAALLVLLIVTIISVYKPWGRTPLGVNMDNQSKKVTFGRRLKTKKLWGLYILVGLIVLVILAFIILHLTGTMGGH